MSHTWVLITDAGRARLFELAGQDGLAEVACFNNPERRTAATGEHDLNERLPRTQDSASADRHVIEPHTSAREKSEKQFAHTIADTLEEGAEQSRYGNLILVAPPRFMGVLRELLPEGLHKLVVGELQHDLVSATTQELKERLRNAFPRQFQMH